MEGLPVRTADAAGHRLAYLETGEGAPVLLVPGYTGSKEDFGPVLAPLAAAGHRVVAFDMRGQLDSPGTGPAESYGPDGLATDLLALVARLGLRPAHVVGHSYGGIVAREAFLREPAAFASLTLLASGPAAIRGARARLMRSLRGELATGGVARVSSLLRAAGGHDSFDAARFDATDPVSLLGMGEALLSAADRVAALAAALAAAAVPCLVACGDADDAWPPAVQEAMAEQLGARFALIAGAGHSPAVEEPAATADVLLAFFEEHARDEEGNDDVR